MDRRDDFARNEGQWDGPEQPRVSGRSEVVAYDPAVTLWYLARV